MEFYSSPSMLYLFVGLAIANLCWAIAAWYRLRHIAGPTSAGWSNIWMYRQILSGRQILHFRAVCEKYGPLTRIGPNWVVCNDPVEFRRIYSVRSGFYRAPWYRTFRFDPSKDSVLTMTDNKAHHRLRANLLPGYSGRGIDNQEKLFDEQILKLVSLIDDKYVSTKEHIRPLDLVRSLQYLTQDIISAVGFGKSFGYLEDDADTYGIIETSEMLFLPLQIGAFFPFTAPLLNSPLVKPFLPKPTDKYGVGRMLGVVKGHVDTRYGPKKVVNNDALQAFVNSDLDKDEVESEALIQLIGGSDTTAAALRICIFYLTTNPTAYRLFQEEIDSVGLAAASEVVSDKVAKSLPYLQAVIKEGLRMWPPIMGLHPRASDRDEVICGVKIPAKTNVGWAVYAIMRDRRVFGEDSDTFDPGRWLNAEPAQLQEMEATQGMVFMAGSRWECLGRRLANIELGKTLFELFRRYDFAMMDPINPFSWVNWGLTLHHGMNAKVTKRRTNASL
ncbi:benzoate 4-monooxygenase cytochrome P450 [Thozetella sp. PMI_491]|nr:benzoate 4-monooxygenase cytochrome P450 [Thozetella sp. PMI_491]